MDLEAIPGVGPTTADGLRQLDDHAAALASGDVAAIARAPDISERRAARIARAAIRRRYGDDGDFLATADADTYARARESIPEMSVELAKFDGQR